MNKRALISVAVVLVIAGGCKKSGSLSAGGAGLAGQSPAEAKLQPVIQCINRTFEHYEQLIPDYRKDVAALAGGATSVPEFISFKIAPYEQNNEFSTACADGLDKAAGMSPAMPAIDPPAKDAAAALRTLQTAGAQMESYLTQKAFLDDHFAKGRQMDATLTPLLNRLGDDMARIREGVRQNEASLKQEELNAIDKKEGHSLSWNTLHTMMAARALDEQVMSMARKRQLTGASVQSAAAPLQAALDEAQAYVAAHPAESKPRANGMPPVWFQISDSFSRELGAAKELQHDLPQGGGPLSETDVSHVNGHLQVITMDFNAAVQNYNTYTNIGGVR